MSTAARSSVYNLLALPLTPPDPVWWAPLCSGEWHAALTDALRELNLDLEVPATLGASSYDQVAVEYARTFLPPAGRLRPMESVYKAWTTLPGAALPIAGQTGWLGGDPAAHLQAVYNACGLVLPQEWADGPDHLALELEFTSLLLDEGEPGQARQFREQHLDWVGDLAADAALTGVPATYRDLLALTARFVAADSTLDA